MTGGFSPRDVPDNDGVLLTKGGFWAWGCYSPWEVSGASGCYSPWEVPDHDGRTELCFLQFADRLHCVPERRFRPTVIYNTRHCKLTGVPCRHTPSIH